MDLLGESGGAEKLRSDRSGPRANDTPSRLENMNR